jgi:hypothetical protein
MLPAALAVKDYSYPALTVTVDGRQVAPAVPGFAFVGNIKEYGTGFPILPHARPDDGLLDVCVLPCRDPRDLVQLFLKAAAGEHLTEEGVVYVKGKHVRVESAGAPVAVQLDGDSAGHTPLDVDLLPFRLAFYGAVRRSVVRSQSSEELAIPGPPTTHHRRRRTTAPCPPSPPTPPSSSSSPAPASSSRPTCASRSPNT